MGTALVIDFPGKLCWLTRSVGWAGLGNRSDTSHAKGSGPDASLEPRCPSLFLSLRHVIIDPLLGPLSRVLCWAG